MFYHGYHGYGIPYWLPYGYHSSTMFTRELLLNEEGSINKEMIGFAENYNHIRQMKKVCDIICKYVTIARLRIHWHIYFVFGDIDDDDDDNDDNYYDDDIVSKCWLKPYIMDMYLI